MRSRRGAIAPRVAASVCGVAGPGRPHARVPLCVDFYAGVGCCGNNVTSYSVFVLFCCIGSASDCRVATTPCRATPMRGLDVTAAVPTFCCVGLGHGSSVRVRRSCEGAGLHVRVLAPTRRYTYAGIRCCERTFASDQSAALLFQWVAGSRRCYVRPI